LPGIGVHPRRITHRLRAWGYLGTRDRPDSISVGMPANVTTHALIEVTGFTCAFDCHPTSRAIRRMRTSNRGKREGRLQDISRLTPR
jgi:hypothetical protein